MYNLTLSPRIIRRETITIKEIIKIIGFLAIFILDTPPL